MQIMPKDGERIVQQLLTNEVVAGFVKQMDAANKTPHEKYNPQITSNHCIETSAFAFEVAKKFIGTNDNKLLLAIALGALLHDIGKSGVDIDELHHPGPLTLVEKRFLDNHPEEGVTIIRKGIDRNQIENTNSNQTGLSWGIWDIATAVIVRHHTQKAKNSYPDNNTIKQLIDDGVLNQTALETVQTKKIDKMVAICDVYSALLANRPYTYESDIA